MATILLAGAGWTCHRQVELNHQQNRLAAVEKELERIGHERTVADEQLDTLHEETAAERSQRDVAMASIALSERRSAARLEEDSWSKPPIGVSEWNPASPYVWLRKETVSRMGVAALNRNGTLTDDVCTLLNIEAPARKAADGALQRTLAEWRASEAALAQRSDAHLQQMRANKGAPFTVRVPAQPELAARLRGELLGVLTEQLGEQRAQLLNRFAEGELDAELGRENPSNGRSGAKAYSVQFDGKMFNIAGENGNSSFNTSSPYWRDMIPAHLQPLFDQALEKR